MRDIVHYISGKSVKGAGTRFGDVFDLVDRATLGMQGFEQLIVGQVEHAE